MYNGVIVKPTKKSATASEVMKWQFTRLRKLDVLLRATRRAKLPPIAITPHKRLRRINTTIATVLNPKTQPLGTQSTQGSELFSPIKKSLSKSSPAMKYWQFNAETYRDLKTINKRGKLPRIPVPDENTNVMFLRSQRLKTRRLRKDVPFFYLPVPTRLIIKP